MPLNSHQKAAVALRLAAARCLDPLCTEIDEEEESGIREGAFCLLKSHAEAAVVRIKDDGDIPDFIREGITSLTEFAGTACDISGSVEILSCYVSELPGQTGDGVVWGAGVETKHCRAGLLELAHHIEAKVRDHIESLGIQLNKRPTIEFRTLLAIADASIPGSRVVGATDVTSSPRLIDVAIADDDLCAADILNMAYVIYHELVCHAFRAALASGRVDNTQDKCIWSHGWMDTVAFDLAVDWVAMGPPNWLPLRDEDGIARLRACHDGHFISVPGLRRSDMTRRQGARNAYRKLATAIASFGLAYSEVTARQLAQQFSWALHIHQAIDDTMRQDIARRIAKAVTNAARVHDQLATVKACLRFSVHRDIKQLDQEIPEL
ncbi:hypothetical protein IB238_05160 [Rhizobium sp. ARZ01]|uniref:hypothetical protein n=1 Tax=Rhizobium sp. ARZ01 TaxID=2769313 RepID=UPI0017837ADB|nr:hypothetical protein [Rhizobium sp. ARZ01]MBD9372025.1 hypothetical protein [Rhizobium sp. ARZ01]